MSDLKEYNFLSSLTCTLLYTVPYKYTIYADLHFKFCFNKKKERKKKELCTVHMFNVIYNTNIRNLPEKMQKQVESLIQEFRRSIICKRYARCTNVNLNNIIYDKNRICAHWIILKN